MPNLRTFIHPLYRRLETYVHPLRYLFIEITQRCNLNCRHCGSDCTSGTQRVELSTANWLAFLAYIKNNLDTERLVLVITGGEPFCHPEFTRLLASCDEHGLTWGLVTNGYALNEKNVALIKAHNVSSVTVSIDGLAQSHDWLRGRQGSFDRAMAGITRLLKRGVLYFDVVTCVHPGNLSELPNVLTLLKRAGVPSWRLFSIFPKGRAKANGELILPPEKYAALLAFIRDARRRSANTGMKVQFSCEGYLPPDIDRQVRDEPYFCRAGINICSVLCDGSISACPNITRDLIQGNIHSDDFKEVWEKRFKPFRHREWMRTGRCQTCREFSSCLGNSLHLWDAVSQQTVLCSYDTIQSLRKG